VCLLGQLDLQTSLVSPTSNHFLASTHELVIKHILGNLQTVDFSFLFECAYLFLVIALRNEELANKLRHVLPEKERLLSWIDCLTELTFLQQTRVAKQRALGEAKDDSSIARIESVVSKIGSLVSKVAAEEVLMQELSGNIEALRENFEIVRASVLKEERGNGEIIKDTISF